MPGHVQRQAMLGSSWPDFSKRLNAVQVNAAQAFANVWLVADDNIQDKRRRRLGAWVEQHGGAAQVVRDRKLSASSVSYISQVVAGHSFGEKAARGWEKKLGMPPGHLDQDDDVDPDFEKMLQAYRTLPPNAQAKAQAFIAGLAERDDAPALSGNRTAA